MTVNNPPAPSAAQQKWPAPSAGAGGTDLSALWDRATPTLYRHNAFRITGMPVAASLREMKRQKARMEMAGSLGLAQTSQPCLPLDPPPTKDQADAASYRLQDPLSRLIDELLWFWPDADTDGEDPALAALQANRVNDALAIWVQQDKDPDAPSPIHNLAVLYHAMALDLELRCQQKGWTDDLKRRCDVYWQRALKRWNQLDCDEAFWKRVCDRVAELDDPRLTDQTVWALRAALPRVALQTSAALAQQAVDRGELDQARRHAAILKASGFGQGMLPEEMSAEILKSLKADVRQSSNEELRAAVITVPAAFELPQCEATRAAGKLAGFENCPLLQEPVAAALAYGFQSASEKVFWLVYDFGGGTFDAAVIQVRDGAIQVVNHAGDNYLGGKLIDWDLVTHRLVPQLEQQFQLPDFRVGNPRYRSAMAKLKLAAEQAKIQICRTDQPFNAWVENVCIDDAGQTVELDVTLTPADLAEVARPYVERSVNLCRKAIEDKGLATGDIEKVLMVGGTTLMPALRQQVSEQLGIELEFSIDPVTAVARGAAVFASTQKLDLPVNEEQVRGKFRFEVSQAYEPVGSDPNPPLGGRIAPPDNQDLAGYTLELVEAKSQWRSGKITLGPEGAFITELHAEPGRLCEYTLELTDPSGSEVSVVPDRVTYTMGMVMEHAPLIHSVGVAMANNEVDVFLQKGTPLPGEHRSIHRTARAVRSQQDAELIRIPVVEGEHFHRADRNRLIGELRIGAAQLRRDLPENTEVEITIRVDESRLVTTRAYVPLLDEEFESELKLEKKLVPVGELREQFTREQVRLRQAREKAQLTSEPAALAALQRIDGEQMVQQVAGLLASAESDPDAGPQCENRLLDLRAAIDEVEDAVELPELIREVNEHLASARQVVAASGQPDEQQRLQALDRDLQDALAAGDRDRIGRAGEQIFQLTLEVHTRQPEFWVAMFQQLHNEMGNMSDPLLAQQLMGRGQQALNAGNVDELRAVVVQLLGMLPSSRQAQLGGYGGTTVR